MTKGRRPVAIGLATAIALLLSACGGSTDREARDPEQAAFEVDHAWAWSEAGPEGYKARTQLELGEFAPLDSAPHVPGFASFDELENACLFDEERDALAPVAVSMASGMDHAETISTRIVSGPSWIYGTNTGATELILATSTPDGVACDWLYDTHAREKPNWTPTWDDVPAGATTDRAYAYLVIRDYLVEGSPKGRPWLRLKRSYLGVDAEAGRWVSSMDGPRTPPFLFAPATIEFAGFPLSADRPPCGIARGGIRCVR